MNQLIIALLVLGLYTTVQVQAQTPVTTPNCKDGFWWDGQKCDICGTGCRTCNATGKCTDCIDGRYLNGDMCSECGITGVKTCCAVSNDSKALRATACYDGYSLEGSICVKLDPNCEQRIDKTFVCNKCKDGYYVDEYNVCVQGTVTGCKSYTNKENCKACNDGFYLAQKEDGNKRFFWGCDACNSNCKCTEEKNKCSSCMDGAVYDSTPKDATTKECSKCPDKTGDNILPSVKCDAKGCLTNGTGCASNAVCIADGSDFICRTLPNCIKVVKDTDGLKCEVCKTGYYVKDRNCVVCTEPTSSVQAEYTKCKSDTEFFQCKQTIWTIPFKDQTYLVPKAGDTSKKECTANENNCQTMKDTTKVCTACYDGWHLVNGVCQNCATEITNCVKCSVTGTGEAAKLQCDACRDNVDSTNRNYYPKEDKTSCLEYPADILMCTTKKDDSAALAGCTCRTNYKIKKGTENTCEKCDDNNCKSCGDKNQDGTAKCFVCNSGYGLISEKCEICPLNCAKCDSNKEVCTTCSTGFFLVDKYCSPKRDRCTTYDKEGCSVCEYNYYRGPQHCLKCSDLAVVAAAGGTTYGAYERFTLADKCPKVDAKTCQPVAPPAPTPSSSTEASGSVTPGPTSGAVTPTGDATTSTTSSSQLFLIASSVLIALLSFLSF